MQGLTACVKNGSLFSKSNGKLQVGYCSMRNRFGGTGRVEQWQSGWVESVKKLLQKCKQEVIVT